MAGSIYNCFRMRWREAWYQLSETQRQELFAEVDAALGQVGGRRLFFCDSRWSNEQWHGFGVEVFPDIEAVQKLIAIHQSLDWYRYVESEHMLGTCSEE